MVVLFPHSQVMFFCYTVQYIVSSKSTLVILIVYYSFGVKDMSPSIANYHHLYFQKVAQSTSDNPPVIYAIMVSEHFQTTYHSKCSFAIALRLLQNFQLQKL